ncbi:MAG: M20/M25/M40 family metallo-hydrolase [Pyrinomonadaceae bacterium]|nr:M20/M25/M40 family metallo-hydrolase [Pyrinomonadaceae bacterium]
MTLFELTKFDEHSVRFRKRKRSGFSCAIIWRGLGWTVEVQEVAPGQNNVIATLNETPRVWISTHMDTVPPYIPPTEDEEKIYGRGACDAKGITHGRYLHGSVFGAEGITDIGLLFTVEEERASTGAKAANMHPLAAKCEYLINGEPTDNDLAIGSKGTFRLMIRTTGKAAHSAYPEEGESAIEKLLDILEDVRHTRLPNDEFFGETIGLPGRSRAEWR